MNFDCRPVQWNFKPLKPHLQNVCFICLFFCLVLTQNKSKWNLPVVVFRLCMQSTLRKNWLLIALMNESNSSSMFLFYMHTFDACKCIFFLSVARWIFLVPGLWMMVEDKCQHGRSCFLLLSKKKFLFSALYIFRVHQSHIDLFPPSSCVNSLCIDIYICIGPCQIVNKQCLVSAICSLVCAEQWRTHWV